jgi:hypothetical protein
MDQTLSSFIAHARKKNMDPATIRMLLLSAGWKEKDIAQALVEQTLDEPIPLPPDVGGAREAFLHLFSFACLFTTLISLTVLLFQYLNRLFPDPAFPDYSDPTTLSGIRWSLAAVIVTFPLFFWITRMLMRDMNQHPDRARSAIRRWLTYITLLVTGLSLVGDVVTLVFYVLEGELTIRFLLKVGAVLLLAGDTFLYYLYSLRQPGKVPVIGSLAVTTVLKWIAGVTVLGAVVWGLYLVGNPVTQRGVHLDEQRVSDLQAIQSEILNETAYDTPQDPAHPRTTLAKPLPASLEEAAANAVYQKLSVRDPVTGVEYGYRVADPTHFDLCAVFDEARDQQYDIAWNHPAGNSCFRIDALNSGTGPKPVQPIRAQ